MRADTGKVATALPKCLRLLTRSSHAIAEVAEFLINAGLDDHVPRFSKHGFHQLDDLERVDAQLLKEMKITAAERTKIIAEVSKLAPGTLQYALACLNRIYIFVSLCLQNWRPDARRTRKNERSRKRRAATAARS